MSGRAMACPSRSFGLVEGASQEDPRQVRKPLPPAEVPIVAYDFGVKYNILRILKELHIEFEARPSPRGRN